MVHVNLSHRADVMVIALSFSWLSLSSIDSESISWVWLSWTKHNSDLDVASVRYVYSEDLEGIQKKKGEDKACVLIYFQRREWSIRPGCTANL